MVTTPPITLVADGLENPANAQTILDAAGMFGCPCLFRDRHALFAEWQPDAESPRHIGPHPFITYEQLAQDYSPVVAFDNVEGAAVLYGFQMPRSPKPAVVVGNERHGIARDILSIADHKVQLPMFARGASTINCLNVAAASAVALYYLSRGGGARLRTSPRPAGRRPELMLLGGQSHVELGSTIGSAGALGWERLFLEDRSAVWFGALRSVIAEGRAAARRHRNPIHLIPASSDSRYAYAEVCVLTANSTRGSTPIHRTNLAKGPKQLLVIPDESTLDISHEPWNRLGKQIRFAHLDLPQQHFTYHYRLIATIALAEVAHQVGQPARTPTSRTKRRRPSYDSALNLLPPETGEIIYLEDLTAY